jgi:hypothetical protein
MNNIRVRKHPGIKGRRPDRKQARRDVALLNAKRRGDSDEKIVRLPPKVEGLPLA